MASGKSLLAAAIVAVALALASIWFVSLVQFALIGSDRITLSGGEFFYGLVTGGVLGFVLHELAHAAAYLAFGARPGLGFKPWTRFGPVFYVSAPGSYLNRTEFVVAGLAPPIFLTALLPLVLAFAPVGGFIYSGALWAYLAGVIGSAGDFVILRNVMSYGVDTRFKDKGDGFDVFGPTGSRAPRR